jgi:integrase
MARMRPPLVPEQPVPVIAPDGLRRMLKACQGKGFEARRDTALIMLLLDTGTRRDELMSRLVTDLDQDLDVLLVLGKGRREHALPYGHKTALALDRYLRVRERHKDAHLPWLWLGLRAGLPRGASVVRGGSRGGIRNRLARRQRPRSQAGRRCDLRFLRTRRDRLCPARTAGSRCRADPARTRMTTSPWAWQALSPRVPC